MTAMMSRPSAIRQPEKLFIGGEWIAPSSASVIDVVDSANEEVFLTVADAQAADVDRAVAAARQAFDAGPWPRMSPQERAVYLNLIADGLAARGDQLADSWTQESGVLRSMSRICGGAGLAATFRYYAGLAESFAWEQKHTSAAWASQRCWCANRSAWSRRSCRGMRRAS